MSTSHKIEQLFKRLLPSPMSIALWLTLLSFFLAIFFTESNTSAPHIVELLTFWGNGLWDGPLLIFAMQMALILVLGHILALSKPISALIDVLTARLQNTAQAAFWVAFLAILVSLFNWGLGLIFGAIFARKVAESASKRGIAINYPLVGAAGYSGLMAWHGGLSGSAPLKANEAGHIHSLMASTWNETQLQLLPNLVPLEDTIFSFSNITASLLLLFVVPTVLFFVAKKANTSIPQIKLYASVSAEKHIAKGAERADHSPYFGRFFGLMLLAFSILQINNASGLSFLTPNYLNGVLLALALLLHKNIQSFLRALDAAIGDAAGILIQFPLYFGIMALMRDSGLVALMADYFATVATVESFPFFTFISAAIINVFVPSGGGQWAVQAPILIEASMQLGVPLSKSIMAMAYGDQLTNMMQPFWALPLLAITGLKAKDILPYSLLVMLVGFVVFFLVLMI